MIARIGLALAFGLVAAAAADAASFDCSKAKTPFAKAICTHPDLSKADDKVAAAFAHATEGLTGGPRATVATAQSEWVKYANRACTADAEPATKPYDKDGITCLGNLFSTRTEQLGHSRQMGGLRFYYVDLFAALPDPDPQSDYSRVATRRHLRRVSTAQMPKQRPSTTSSRRRRRTRSTLQR